MKDLKISRDELQDKTILILLETVRELVDIIEQLDNKITLLETKVGQTCKS